MRTRKGNNTVLIIPLSPLSVNEAFKGRKFKTAKYKKFEQDCSLFIPQGDNPIIKEIRIFLILKHPLRRDADNCAKAIMDILQKRGQMKNDRYIDKLYIERIKGDEDKIIVELIE